jgi:hypothetical protein
VGIARSDPGIGPDASLDLAGELGRVIGAIGTGDAEPR